MLLRCQDEDKHPQLFHGIRAMHDRNWTMAFPNLFITITVAEWKFPRPYFLQPYAKCLWAGAYLLALHTFYLVKSMWQFLSNRLGHRWFTVVEWVSVKIWEQYHRVGMMLLYVFLCIFLFPRFS